jgi:hypothetical protein
MKKIVNSCLLATILICIMALSAMAAPITGAISFSGTSVADNEDLSLATAFTNFSNVVVSTTGGTEDYIDVMSGQAVVFSPFTFSPMLSPLPLVSLWAFTAGGINYSFDATDVIINSSSSHTLALRGTGIARIDGFDDTPGNWYFSANRAGGTASFSASTEVSSVPEPASMLLMGMGLLGIGAFGRRKKSSIA